MKSSNIVPIPKKSQKMVSPLIFSIYTNEFKIVYDHFRLFKYADNMALVALLQKEDGEKEQAYFNHVSVLQDWCLTSYLEIIVSMTK